MRHEILIDGMSCGHCAKAVEKALRGVEGVEQVEVEVGRAVVHTAPAVDLEKLREAIAAEGYQPRP